jgi:Fe-S-cluster containining protein
MLKYGETDKFVYVSMEANSLPIWFTVQYVGGVKFMGVNSRCFCGSGKKVKHCHPNINEESLVAKLLSLYAVIDKRNSKAKTICQEGCAECCDDNFEIYFAEFLAILDYLSIENKHGNEQTRCRNWRKMTEEWNPKVEGVCFFLYQKEKTCKIYAVRPLICRNYGTTKQDTEVACSKLYNSTTPLELVDAEEFPKIDTAKNRLYIDGKLNGKNLRVLQKKLPLSLWLKSQLDEYGNLTEEKTKKLLHSATKADVNEFLRVLEIFPQAGLNLRI